MTDSTVNTPDAGAQWEALLANFNRANAACCLQAGLPDAEIEKLGDEIADCTAQLLGMPSPDRAALLWKFEHLLEVDESGGTSIWSGETVRQTLDDARAMLSGRTMSLNPQWLAGCALKIQEQTDRIKMLADLAFEAVSEITNAEGDQERGKERRSDALNRLALLSNMIGECGAAAGHAAECIEVAA